MRTLRGMTVCKAYSLTFSLNFTSPNKNPALAGFKFILLKARIARRRATKPEALKLKAYFAGRPACSNDITIGGTKLCAASVPDERTCRQTSIPV